MKTPLRSLQEQSEDGSKNPGHHQNVGVPYLSWRKRLSRSDQSVQSRTTRDAKPQSRTSTRLLARAGGLQLFFSVNVLRVSADGSLISVDPQSSPGAGERGSIKVLNLWLTEIHPVGHIWSHHHAVQCKTGGGGFWKPEADKTRKC